MMKTKEKFLFFAWSLTVLSLFFYSFSQIDLGLTLTRASFWQVIQKRFQYLGYFNRPLSTALYLGILLFLFLFYFFILKRVWKGKFSSPPLWRLILVTALILWFSYNAFSHDLFNYIFDAKIFTFYHQSPYLHKALDYQGDPMLGFMHWTHRTYPYGPSWLAITIPLSFLGFQKLVPTMILFKATGVLGYLGCAWFLDKITSRSNPKKRLISLAFFAFNPLIIVESLVSAHHEALMMALVLAAFWLWLENRPLLSWLTFLFSVGIKFASGVLLPVFLLLSYLKIKKKKVNWSSIWTMSLLLMSFAVAYGIQRSNYQPWYLVWLLPLIALLPDYLWLVWLSLGFSLGSLLRYAPYFYTGNWGSLFKLTHPWLTLLPPFFCFLILLYYQQVRKIKF